MKASSSFQIALVVASSIATTGCMNVDTRADAGPPAVSLDSLHPAGMNASLLIPDTGSCSTFCSSLDACDILYDFEITYEECLDGCGSGVFGDSVNCVRESVDCYDVEMCIYG